MLISLGVPGTGERPPKPIDGGPAVEPGLFQPVELFCKSEFGGAFAADERLRRCVRVAVGKVEEARVSESTNVQQVVATGMARSCRRFGLQSATRRTLKQIRAGQGVNAASGRSVERLKLSSGPLYGHSSKKASVKCGANCEVELQSYVSESIVICSLAFLDRP